MCHRPEFSEYPSAKVVSGVYPLDKQPFIQLPVLFYHPDCLVCKQCGAKLDINSFQVKDCELQNKSRCNKDDSTNCFGAPNGSMFLQLVRLKQQDSVKKTDDNPQCELSCSSSSSMRTDEELTTEPYGKNYNSYEIISDRGPRDSNSHGKGLTKQKSDQIKTNSGQLTTYTSMKTIHVRHFCIPTEIFKSHEAPLAHQISFPKSHSYVTSTLFGIEVQKGSVSEQPTESDMKLPSFQHSVSITPKKLLILYQCSKCHNTMDSSEMLRYSSYFYHTGCAKCCVCQAGPT
ncbi:unnamed protein product [Dicrocoelium dendriticum]|nr:unnamed protein product [Dicrocoelium dendriticum]